MDVKEAIAVLVKNVRIEDAGDREALAEFCGQDDAEPGAGDGPDPADGDTADEGGDDGPRLF